MLFGSTGIHLSPKLSSCVHQTCTAFCMCLTSIKWSKIYLKKREQHLKAMTVWCFSGIQGLTCEFGRGLSYKWCVFSGHLFGRTSFCNPKGCKVWKPFILLLDDLNLSLTLLDKLLALTIDGALKMNFESMASLALSKVLKKSQPCWIFFFFNLHSL